MSANNISELVKVVDLLPAQSIAFNASTVLSAAVDARGFRWALLVLEVVQGATALDGAAVCTLYSSATTGGTYAALVDDTYNMTDGATANVSSIVTVDAEAEGVYLAEIDLDQHNKFLKIDVNPAGTAGAAIFSAKLLLGSADDSSLIANTLQFQILTADKAAW